MRVKYKKEGEGVAVVTQTLTTNKITWLNVILQFDDKKTEQVLLYPGKHQLAINWGGLLDGWRLKKEKDE